MYSAIPMPAFEIDDDDIGHSIASLPLIGLVIAIAEYYVNLISETFGFSLFVRCMLFIAVPVLITGGFHFDGYLDRKDALHSYLPRDKKLEILSDPHVGAFGIIKLVLSLVLAMAFLGVIFDKQTTKSVVPVTLIFVQSRAMAGLTSLFIGKARDSGMLRAETRINNGVIYGSLIFWLILALAVSIAADPVSGIASAASLVLFTLYYRGLVLRAFGGVTGDTAGYFVTASELFALFAFAIVTVARVAL